MKNKHLLLVFAALLLPALLSGCGLEIFRDWQNSTGEAMPGAGAIAGKDYITGLEPSSDARDYFSMISDDKPIETVSRTDGKESKSGVKFVGDGGIVIPPGVTIAFDNKGYCLDPNLPAPKEGDEYQFVPMKRLIPTELQGTYKKLIAQESAGNADVKANMQRLVWAMRTAGTESALANGLTSQQKQILDRCSDYSGQFESFNESAKSSNQLRKELNKLFDSLVTIEIGGETYTASDLLNPESGKQKITNHINHLIELGESLPVEHTGFNFGELEPGIYTDIQGTGYMQFHVRIANNTGKAYTFYPSDYVGQVGSPTKSSGLNLFATSCTGKQRMTCSNQNKTDVVDKKEPQKEEQSDQEESEKCPPHEWVKLPKNNIQGLKRLSDVMKTMDEHQWQVHDDLIKEKQNEGWQLGLQNNREYGGIIYKYNGEIFATPTRPGKYSQYEISVGKQDLPEGAEIISVWHSHGGPNDQNGNMNLGAFGFSATDYAGAGAAGCLLYLIDPKGKTHIYNPINKKRTREKYDFFDNWGPWLTNISREVGEFEERQFEIYENATEVCNKCGTLQ